MKKGIKVHSGAPVVEMILQKKVLRKKTMYQVNYHTAKGLKVSQMSGFRTWMTQNCTMLQVFLKRDEPFITINRPDHLGFDLGYAFSMPINYQVLWLGQSEVNTTWEVAEMLPTTLVKEFEDGIVSETTEDYSQAYGMNRSTFIVSARPSKQLKRSRIDRPTIDQTTG